MATDLPERPLPPRFCGGRALIINQNYSKMSNNSYSYQYWLTHIAIKNSIAVIDVLSCTAEHESVKDLGSGDAPRRGWHTVRNGESMRFCARGSQERSWTGETDPPRPDDKRTLRRRKTSQPAAHRPVSFCSDKVSHPSLKQRPPALTVSRQWQTR